MRVRSISCNNFGLKTLDELPNSSEFAEGSAAVAQGAPAEKAGVAPEEDGPPGTDESDGSDVEAEAAAEIADEPVESEGGIDFNRGSGRDRRRDCHDATRDTLPISMRSTRSYWSC